MYLVYQLQEWLKKRHHQDLQLAVAAYTSREREKEQQKRREHDAELEREWESRVQRIEEEFSLQRGRDQ